MNGVRLEDAEALNVLVDGASEASLANRGNILGFLRWLPPDGSLNVVMTYSISSTAGTSAC